MSTWRPRSIWKLRWVACLPTPRMRSPNIPFVSASRATARFIAYAPCGKAISLWPDRYKERGPTPHNTSLITTIVWDWYPLPSAAL